MALSLARTIRWQRVSPSRAQMASSLSSSPRVAVPLRALAIRRALVALSKFSCFGSAEPLAEGLGAALDGVLRGVLEGADEAEGALGVVVAVGSALLHDVAPDVAELVGWVSIGSGNASSSPTMAR